MIKKIGLLSVITLVIIVISLVVVRFIFGGEDTWLCQDGIWVKHGHPDLPSPQVGCGEAVEATVTPNAI